jgi:redox-sensitive bicupin YhaK (pirin superfamily)
VTQPLRPGRAAWLQVLTGNVAVNDQPLGAGDGVAVSDETALTVQAASASEILLFDLA